MSWVTEDGLHEGYCAHIAKDGREATCTSAAGMHMKHGKLVDGEWVGGEVLPWSELLGWEARCDCRSDGLAGVVTTVGPLWREGIASGADETTVEEWGHAWWLEHLAGLPMSRPAL